MTFWSAFGIGLLGALFIYIARFRHTRLQAVLVFPKENWRVILFDLLIFILCGGLCAAFLINPTSPKEAFLGGATWEGLMTSIVPVKE